jgi:hypothetical protein
VLDDVHPAQHSLTVQLFNHTFLPWHIATAAAVLRLQKI